MEIENQLPAEPTRKMVVNPMVEDENQLPAEPTVANVTSELVIVKLTSTTCPSQHFQFTFKSYHWGYKLCKS